MSKHVVPCARLQEPAYLSQSAASPKPQAATSEAKKSGGDTADSGLETLKQKELQALCIQAGVPKWGSKAAMIARLRAHKSSS